MRQGEDAGHQKHQTVVAHAAVGVVALAAALLAGVAVLVEVDQHY